MVAGRYSSDTLVGIMLDVNEAILCFCDDETILRWPFGDTMLLGAGPFLAAVQIGLASYILTLWQLF